MKFSDIPSTTELLKTEAVSGLEHRFAVQCIASLCQRVRREIATGVLNRRILWEDELLVEVQQQQEKRYKRVVNATGIVIHTNLGRAPLSQEVLDYVVETCSGYCDLELQLATGKRGGRLSGIREKLCQLSKAEDAVVVNNNAAAILLILSAISAQKEVIVSRGELVEIGGSFRVPEVIEQGGAILKEVGTTNRTRIADYRRAISEETGALLKVHQSNFSIEGFSEEASRQELAQLARERDIPFVEDLGSGLLHRSPKVPWKEEFLGSESIQRALEEGVDLLCFSGDKLLGGNQVGIILGRADLVKKCRNHPLYRAFRLDKMNLAALEATLQIYVEGREEQLPIWRMINQEQAVLHQRAQRFKQAFSAVRIAESEAYTGGGALPNRSIPSVSVVCEDQNIKKLSAFLRRYSPPILARSYQDKLWFDLRTMTEEEDEIVLEALKDWFRSKTLD